MALTGKLTKKLVENLGAGRHGDGGGLYLVVDPSGARRWIVRVVVKGQRNLKGAPLRTDFGLGGAGVVTLNQARERALEYRRMAKQGLNPRFNASREIPTFEEVARQVHIDRMPTWKNGKHGAQWINTLRDYAFPKIGRMPVDSIGQPEVLMCLSPIWTDKHETARRLAQRVKIVLDVAKSKGFRSGENPVSAISEAQGAKDAVIRQAKEVEKQIEDLLDRLIEAASPSVVKAYETRIEKLGRDKLVLAERASRTLPEKGRLEEFIELSVVLLANPWNIWTNGPLSLGQAVLRLAFPEPLRYCRQNGYRTPESAYLFKVLATISSQK